MASLEFQFEELAILDEGGIQAGLMNGTAEISYYPDGEYHVGKIYLDGFRKCADGKGFDRVPVELEYEQPSRIKTLQAALYLAIWSELTDGSFKASVEAAVSKALEAHGVPLAPLRSEHSTLNRAQQGV